jgi:hypothetical protein
VSEIDIDWIYVEIKGIFLELGPWEEKNRSRIASKKLNL